MNRVQYHTEEKNKDLKDDTFNVITYAVSDKTSSYTWAHWSEGLSMVITKGDKTIILDEAELRQLVKTLPRTFGGQY